MRRCRTEGIFWWMVFLHERIQIVRCAEITIPPGRLFAVSRILPEEVRRKVKRWFIAAGVALVLIGGGMVAVGLDWRFFLLTGHFAPQTIVESLHSPVAILSVGESGLQAADGKTIHVPGFSQLALPAVVARDILAHGVEVRPDGTVFALVRVHHWCGNDPVRHHLGRVDLSSLLVLLEEREGNVTDIGVDPGIYNIASTPHQELPDFLDSRRNSATNP